MPTPTSPPDSYQTKARALRALYRDTKPRSTIDAQGKLTVDQVEQRDQWLAVSAEYERLFGQPSTNGALEQILTTAWIEGRELDGQRYDYQRQRWLDADGNPVD